jgi:hypothetical protein
LTNDLVRRFQQKSAKGQLARIMRDMQVLESCETTSSVTAKNQKEIKQRSDRQVSG